MSLIDKIKAARQSVVTVGALSYTITRPTALSLSAGWESGFAKEAVLRRYVVGWNHQEIDLIPGGSPVLVPFETELFIEFVADLPETIGALLAAINDLYDSHNKASEIEEKKT